MAGLDLSALDDDTPTSVSDGKALRAPLAMFIPDPDQLNRERDQEADDRDREDIRNHGVMQPIVASTPGPDGRMHIRIGHRRWRLSGEAGLPDLPYVYEVAGVIYDDYAKMAENRKRKNDTPLDIAKLVVKRKALGEKHTFIAKRISIDPSEITTHLVLVEGPAYIRELYHQNKCRTPKYLYDLANLAKIYPEEVSEFCATSDDFEGKTIKALGDRLKNLGNTKEIPSNSAEQELATTNSVTSAPGTEGEGAGTWPFPGGGNTDSKEKPAPSNAGEEEVSPPSGGLNVINHIPSHNPENEKSDAPPTLADPSKMKKPLLLGTYKGSDVMVLLYKRPTSPGLAHVKHENGTGEEEVEFGKIKNLTLTESKL